MNPKTIFPKLIAYTLTFTLLFGSIPATAAGTDSLPSPGGESSTFTPPGDDPTAQPSPGGDPTIFAPPEDDQTEPPIPDTTEETEPEPPGTLMGTMAITPLSETETPTTITPLAGDVSSGTFDLSSGTWTDGSTDATDHNCAWDGSTLTVGDGANITVTGTASEPRRILVNGRATITLDDASLTAPNGSPAIVLNSGADLSLTLAEGSENTVSSGEYSAGIGVPAGTKITINGTGSLSATGGAGGAGIGGSFSGGSLAAGEIIITSGIITATGGTNSAGIGGGRAFSSGGAGGTVTINGGTVTAIGTGSGAGIGGGSNGAGGTVTINGGTVTATSGIMTDSDVNSARAIGAGAGGAAGTVTINGGFAYLTNNTTSAPDGTPEVRRFDNDSTTFAESHGYRYIYLERRAVVSFDSQGGSEVADTVALDGGIITPPAVPTKENVFFYGWYSDEDLGTPWDFATDIATEDMTLYARWLTAAPKTWDGNGSLIEVEDGDIILIAPGATGTLTVPADAIVTIIGGSANVPVDNANRQIVFTINDSATVVWEAYYTGQPSGNPLVTITDSTTNGTFKVESGLIRHERDGGSSNHAISAISNINDATGEIIISGGVVTTAADNGTGNAINGNTMDVTVTGGYVHTDRQGQNYGILTSSGNITVDGGEVRVTSTDTTSRVISSSPLSTYHNPGDIFFLGGTVAGVNDTDAAIGAAMGSGPPDCIVFINSGTNLIGAVTEPSGNKLHITRTDDSILHIKDTSDGLEVRSAGGTVADAARWDVGGDEDGVDGISYSHDGNEGFFPVPGVRVYEDFSVNEKLIEVYPLTVAAIQAAIDGALATAPPDGTVTVAGNFDGADETLQLIIPQDKKVLWSARYSGSIGGEGINPVIRLGGSGSFDGGELVLGPGGLIENTADGWGMEIPMDYSYTITVDGGELKAGGEAIFLAADSTLTVKNDGKIVSASSMAVSLVGNSALIVEGGEISRTNPSPIPLISAGGTAMLTLKGGTLEAAVTGDYLVVLFESALLAVYGGTIKNTDATASVGRIVQASGDSVVYVEGGTFDSTAQIYTGSDNTSAYYIGEERASLFSGFGANLHRLDVEPTLTNDDGTAHNAEDAPYKGRVTATFPAGLDITAVTATPATATHHLSANTVTFAGTYKETVQLDVTGTIADGRASVQLSPEPFDLNIDTQPIAVDGVEVTENTVAGIQTAIQAALYDDAASVVRVTGHFSGADETLELIIPPDKKLEWSALYRGAIAGPDYLIRLGSGGSPTGGELVLKEGGLIENSHPTGRGMTIPPGSSYTVTVEDGGELKAGGEAISIATYSRLTVGNGGKIVSASGTAVDVMQFSALIVNSGGEISQISPLSTDLITATGSATITVNGGTLRANGTSNNVVWLQGSALLAVYGGIIKNDGDPSRVANTRGNSVVYIQGGTFDSAARIYTDSATASIYHVGDRGDMFVYFDGQRHRLDVPILTNDDGETHNPSNQHQGKVNAIFPAGLVITDVTVNHDDVFFTINGATVVLMGTYKHDDITLTIKGTLADGRADVEFDTEAFAMNVDSGDIIPPTAMVKYGSNDFRPFTNSESFSLFFKDSVDVTIEAADDDGSGVAQLAYFITDTSCGLPIAENLDSVAWTVSATNDAVSLSGIEAKRKGFIYVRVTDVAGNVAYFMDSVVIYADSTPQAATIDHAIGEAGKSLTINLNGNEVAAIRDDAADLAPQNYSISYDDATDTAEISFSHTYLNGLAAGEKVLTISYDPLGVPYVGTDENGDPIEVNAAPDATILTLRVTGTAAKVWNSNTPPTVQDGDTVRLERAASGTLVLPENAQVTIIGGSESVLLDKEDFALYFTIPASSRVLWRAFCTIAERALINLSADSRGTFEVAGGRIRTWSFHLIDTDASTTGQIIVSGGSLEAGSVAAINVRGAMDISISGGIVSGGGDPLIYSGGGDIMIFGGRVENTSTPAGRALASNNEERGGIIYVDSGAELVGSVDMTGANNDSLYIERTTDAAAYTRHTEDGLSVRLKDGSPISGAAWWDVEGGISGIRHAKDENAGFFAVPGLEVQGRGSMSISGMAITPRRAVMGAAGESVNYRLDINGAKYDRDKVSWSFAGAEAAHFEIAPDTGLSPVVTAKDSVLADGPRTVELVATYKGDGPGEIYTATAEIEIIPPGDVGIWLLLGNGSKVPNVAVNRAREIGAEIPIRLGSRSAPPVEGTARRMDASGFPADMPPSTVVGWVRLTLDGGDGGYGATPVPGYEARICGDNRFLQIRTADEQSNEVKTGNVSGVHVWYYSGHETGDAALADTENWNKAAVGGTDRINLRPRTDYPKMKWERVSLNRFLPDVPATISGTNTRDGGAVTFTATPDVSISNGRLDVAANAPGYANNMVRLGAKPGSASVRMSVAVAGYKEKMLRAWNEKFDGHQFDVRVSVGNSAPSLRLSNTNLSMRHHELDILPQSVDGSVWVDVLPRNNRFAEWGAVEGVSLTGTNGATTPAASVWAGVEGTDWKFEDGSGVTSVRVPASLAATDGKERYQIGVKYVGNPEAITAGLAFRVGNPKKPALSVRPGKITLDGGLAGETARIGVASNPLNLAPELELEYRVSGSGKNAVWEPLTADYEHGGQKIFEKVERNGSVMTVKLNHDVTSADGFSRIVLNLRVVDKRNNSGTPAEADSQLNAATHATSTPAVTLTINPAGSARVTIRTSGRLSVIEPERVVNATVSLAGTGAQGIETVTLYEQTDGETRTVESRDFEATVNAAQNGFSIRIKDGSFHEGKGYGFGHLVPGQKYPLSWELELAGGIQIKSWELSGKEKPITMTPNQTTARIAKPGAATLINADPYRTDDILITMISPGGGASYDIVTFHGPATGDFAPKRAANGTITRTQGFGKNGDAQTGLEMVRNGESNWTLRMLGRVPLRDAKHQDKGNRLVAKMELWPLGSYQLDADGEMLITDANKENGRPLPIQNEKGRAVTKPVSFNVTVNIRR